MRLQTPFRFHRFAYFGLDTKARAGDELLAMGIGRLYAGLYPTQNGVEFCYGILNAHGCLD